MARYDDDDDDQRVMTLDDLLGPVPEPSPSSSQADYYTLDDFSNATSYAVSDKNPSKSQRVRNYLEEKPEARNRDVVDALAAYGVTAADVSNAKAQLKRKGEMPSKRGRTPASSASTPTAVTAKPASASPAPAGGVIAMQELEAAITFVRQVGDIERAKHLLVIIQEVQKM
ncbi:MAG: hypothetical protein IT423_15445 [Pirellulaceae bacterium]|nr:hypothetical protein [Pirellulaceae bacterium]